MNAIINCVSYCEGKRVDRVDLDQIATVLQQSDQFIWIGLHEPDEELLRKVQSAFGLHDLAIEDAHLAHQRPKIEVYGDSLFIVLRTAQLDPERQVVDFGETHIFVGAQYLVSVRHGSSVSYVDVRTRSEAMPHLLRKGPGFALYALMDAIVDQYFPVINALEDQLQVIEDRIFGIAFERETTAKIYHLKRELLEIKRAILPLIEMCNRLMRFDLAVIPEDTRVYFRDVHDHAIRMNEMVDTLRELLTTALDAHFSLISINQNDVMKRFAGWASIIAVPTMIAGIYGMNFSFMPELTTPFGYPLVMLVILGSSGFLYNHFRRSGWL
jgi:magnesium transporter